jgi:cell pole-organizing protein PopZ
MSSTERAPEPTMEEILASIRRIITDDDTGQARAQNAAPLAHQDEEPLEGEGEADSQIIDDIARVLSGSGGGAVEVDEEEEILDLTAELGGLELVDDDEPLSEPVSAEPANVEPMVEQTSAEPMTMSQPAPMAEPAPQDEVPSFVPPAPPAQEAAPPQMRMDEPQPPMPEAPMPQAPQAAAPQPSASLEAASALERAIAALRAGQVPTSTTPQAEPFQFQAAPQPEAMTPEAMPTPTFMPASEQTAEPEPVPMAIPMEAPEPQAETHPEMEAELASEPEAFELMAEQAQEPEQEFPQDLEAESDQEAELVLTEVEVTMVTEDLVELEAAEPEAESEPETATFWPSESPAWQEGEDTETEPAYEPEPVAAQANGRHEPEGASMTLEDSVKDMLRPMLRQWLDENMPRMVTAALKDELDPNAFRQQD